MAYSFSRILYSIKDKFTVGGFKNLPESDKYRFEQKEKFERLHIISFHLFKNKKSKLHFQGYTGRE